MKPETQNYFAVLSLGAILALRLIGLFMILPVFALYAASLSGSTYVLMGIAVGGYGLTQALLQLPFGMLSDKFGRKPIITLGLILFGLGSVIAACSDSIYGVIIGRLMQGGGAIGSTIIASVADLTTEKQRTKAMAIIGMMIGGAFFVAMVLGPLLHNFIDIPGLFWLSTTFAGAALLLLYLAVPTAAEQTKDPRIIALPTLIKTVLKNGDLTQLNIGIFLLHAMLTACFIAVPIALGQIIGLPTDDQWQFYLPVLGLAFGLMIALLFVLEKRSLTKQFFPFAIAAMMVSQALLAWHHNSIISLSVGLLVFFIAFSYLESYLPSAVSRLAPTGSKGTAMGVYSTSQFLGIFIGGILGGLLYSYAHITGVFCFGALISGLWLGYTMRPQTVRKIGEAHG